MPALKYWDGAAWQTLFQGLNPGYSYTTTIGDGSTTVFTITHNLNAPEVVCVVREASGDLSYVYPEIRKLDSNSLRLIFDVAPATNAYTVFVAGGAFVSSATPSGPAGGDLSGSYPNPGIAAGAIVDADIAAGTIEGRRVNVHKGSSPPGSPQDGDYWLLSQAVGGAANTYWLLQYDSAESTAYKWKFIGGGAWWTQSLGVISGTTIGWSFYSGGLTLTVPRAGYYEWDWSCRGQAGAASGNTALGAGVSVNSTTSPTLTQTGASAASNGWTGLSGCGILSMGAGDVARMLTYQNSGGVCPFDNRALKCRPIAIA